MAVSISSLVPAAGAVSCPLSTEQQQRGFVRRMTFLAFGILFLMLAIAGVILPGVPTTGPLIAASFFLTKSCPKLERQLVRNRFFASYLQYLDGRAVMSNSVRRKAITAMWTSIALSWMVVSISTGPAPLFSLGMLIGGSVGTIFIWKYRRHHLA